MTDLVLGHVSLVRAIAIEMKRRLPPCVELDDAIQWGYLGLMRASHRFDSSRGVTFGAYARYLIKGAIYDGVRHGDWASRQTRRFLKSVEKAEWELGQELSAQPSSTEIAERLGLTVMPQVSCFGVESASRRPESHKDNAPDRDFEGHPEWSPERIAERHQTSDYLDAATSCLQEPGRLVIRLYYRDGLPQKDIASRMGLSEARIQQIRAGALVRMRTWFVKRGIERADQLAA